jgi:hypothetical protein
MQWRDAVTHRSPWWLLGLETCVWITKILYGTRVNKQTVKNLKCDNPPDLKSFLKNNDSKLLFIIFRNPRFNILVLDFLLGGIESDFKVDLSIDFKVF